MSKKITLINPTSKDILRGAGDRPPLGLLYIASALETKGHKATVIDMDHTTDEELMKHINKEKPDYVGVSAYTSPMYPEAIGLSKLIGDKCIKVVGGHHATAIPGSLTRYFDAVVQREGEYAMLDIVENGRTGVIDGGMVKAEDIPMPARHLIDLKKYTMLQDDKPTATLVSSRGCPNNCCFCSNQTRSVRYVSIENMMLEIGELMSNDVRSLYFYDDCFTANKKRAHNLLRKLEDKNLSYRITTRAKSLDEGLVKHLADTGCSWISIGVESGSNERLKDIGKNMDVFDNYKAVELCTKYGIKTKGFFMFGLPNESPKDAQKTIDFACYLKKEGLASADFYILTPFPGTPIWKNPEKYGIEILDRDYTKYLEAGKNPPKAFHRTKYMEPDVIEKYRKEAQEKWNLS